MRGALGSAWRWAVRPGVSAFVLFPFSGLGLGLGGPVAGQSGPTAPPPLATVSERITVTATGEEVSADGLPVSVTVIDREAIDRSREETVAGLIRRVPGVTVLRSGDTGGVTTFFLRGTESDHVLALFDGVRLNSPYFAGFDWSLLSSAGIERVEVARGPFSALWGSDAIGGVVNVIPGRGSDDAKGVLLGEAGDDEWQRVEGTLGWGGDALDLFASAFERQGKGRLENSDFSNRQLLLDAGYSWSEGDRAAVLYQGLASELGIPLSAPDAPSPNRRQDTDQALVAVPVSLRPTASWGLQVSPSWVDREVLFRDPDDPFGFVRGDTFVETRQFRLASHHDLGGRSGHDVSWGAEWREDEVDASSNFGVDLDGDVTRVESLFAQDVWRATEHLTVIAGLRWDDADAWGDQTSPKLSVGWEVASGVELRASYGEAFRQPSIGELYFPFSGNPQLEPERSKSAEVGATLRLGRQRLDVAAFATNTDDLIDFDGATFAFANVEEVEVRGAELAWRSPVSGLLDSTLSATWLGTDDQDGRSLLRRPEWSASWTLSGRIGRSLRVDLSAFWVGRRADVDAVTFERKHAGSYATANLALGYRLAGGLELTARVSNLADREYEEIDGFPSPGRRILGGLRWSR